MTQRDRTLLDDNGDENDNGNKRQRYNKSTNKSNENQKGRQTIPSVHTAKYATVQIDT